VSDEREDSGEDRTHTRLYTPPERSTRQAGSQPPALEARTGVGGRGGHLALLHVERSMIVYPIVEAELNTIAVMNILSGVAFSVAGVFLGFAANIWIDAAFYKEIPLEAKVMVTYGAPLCLILSVIFVVGGIIAIGVRRTTWRRVRRSVTTETSAAAPR
jgi:hypothetical protein